MHLVTCGFADAALVALAFGFFIGFGTPSRRASRPISAVAAATSPWPDWARCAALARSPVFSIG